MSLFDQLGGMLGGDNSQLLQSAQTLLNDNGGISGLVEKFQQGGLGDIVSSWVGTGANLPISAEQIQAVLGNEQIAGLAAKLGLDSSQLSQQLAEHLPTLVDSLTPGGELPADNLLAQGLDLAKGLFNR